MKMRNIVLAVVLLASVTVFASVKFFSLSNVDLGHQDYIKCGTGTSCSVVSGKLLLGVSYAGVVEGDVVASATTITAAQCGSTFRNAGAIEIELPEASAVIGCRLTFITGNASNFDVDPDAGDQILVQTDTAGDKIRNATLGNSITIQAISASTWAPVAIIGTWSDAN